jgi:hypothetical protein
MHVLRYRDVIEWQDSTAGGPVRTDCCHCNMPAAHAQVRIMSDDWNMTAEWRCRPGFGCDANPRRRIGMHLRPGPVDCGQLG